jgi:hypothetical protein
LLFLLSNPYTLVLPFLLCSTDESETHDLAAEFPALAKAMIAKLYSYQPYVDGNMTPTELANYNCTPAVGNQWHTTKGRFSGPCCAPKAKQALPPSSQESPDS